MFPNTRLCPVCGYDNGLNENYDDDVNIRGLMSHVHWHGGKKLFNG